MINQLKKNMPQIMSNSVTNNGGGSAFNFQWPFPDFRKPHAFWKFRSRYCIMMVGLLGKVAMTVMNSSKIRNREILFNAISNRPKGVPLITVANHESCMDDPGLIALFMTMKQLADQENMRWNLAAHDICFSKPFHATFFAHGKCIPTVRGLGVYQKAVDFIIERMNENGDWVHIFPEGRVNMERNELYRLKWGIGRIIAECETTPIVIPFWHTGMADVLPSYKPYIPRIGKKVFMNVGQPLQIQPVLDSVQDKSPVDKRKIITDFIQSEMNKLRKETLELAKVQSP